MTKLTYDSKKRLKRAVFANGSQMANIHDASGKKGTRLIVPNFVASSPIFNGYRFSLSSSSPVPASDILSATSGYLVPFTSDCMTLLNSSNALFTNSSDGGAISLSFSSFLAGHVYRIFASDPSESGTTSLSATAWTSITNPGTALALEEAAPGGFLVLQSNPTLRYVADVFCNTTNGQVNDALKDRGVFNVNNKVSRRCAAIDPGPSSWAVGVGNTQTRDNNTTEGVGRFGVLIGSATDAMVLSMDGECNSTSPPSLASYQFGFAVDATNTFTRSQIVTADGQGVTGQGTGFSALWTYQPAIGRHYFQAMEGAIGSGARNGVSVNPNSPETVLEAYVSI